MSAIPPDFVGPILQAGAKANQVAGQRDGTDNQRVETQRTTQAAADQRATSVSDADEENGVQDSSTGVGGEGRSFGEGDAEPDAGADTNTPDDGIRKDDDGRLHLDIQA
jgi:hypothetical protein